MASIKVVGSAAIVTSSLKVETLDKMAKYNPKALKMFEKDEDGNKVLSFQVRRGNCAEFDKNGVVFCEETEEGNMQLTFGIPTCVKTKKAKKQYIRDFFGFALTKLNKFESEVEEKDRELDKLFESVEEKIVIE